MVLEKKYKPPFVPKLYNDFDLRYFDIGFTSDNVESLENNTNFKSRSKAEGISALCLWGNWKGENYLVTTTCALLQ